MIDIQDEPLKPHLRDSEVFERAQHAYKQVGLIQHEKKRKRDQIAGTILGADFDGPGLSGRVNGTPAIAFWCSR